MWGIVPGRHPSTCKVLKSARVLNSNRLMVSGGFKLLYAFHNGENQINQELKQANLNESQIILFRVQYLVFSNRIISKKT